MFNLFKRYVDEKYIKFESGQIWFGRERMALYFVPYSAGELFLNRRLYGWKYTAAKFIFSRAEGSALTKQHGTPNAKAFTSPINASLKIMNMLGMGFAFKIVKTDDTKGFAVLAGVSTLGLETKTKDEGDSPVDFVIGGLMAGTVQYYTKKPTYSVEISCVAQNGVDGCMWVIGSRTDVMNYIQNSFPEKAGSAKTTLDQIEAVEKEIGESASLSGII